MPRPASFRQHRLAVSAGLALLLPSVAHAAAFLPGAAPEPDPPTGEKPAPAAAPAGNGIRWTLAPWRSDGALTVDLRALRLDDGSRSTQQLVFADVDVASHVWEPWFIQLRAGLGLLGDRTQGSGGTVNGGGSASVTGRVAVSVFPASRFPFELRADVSDSRTRGDSLGNDVRATRLSLSQSWRPEEGNDQVALHLDHSRLDSDRAGSDTLTAASLLATRQLAEHSFELNTTWSRNERGDTGDTSRLTSLAARHGFHPRGNLVVDTLASRNDVDLRTGGVASGSSVRQLSTVATWRPVAGEPLYVADAPVTLGGSARWVDTVDAGGLPGARAVNASAGASVELGPAWRVTGSAAGGRFESAGGQADTSASANLAATFTPAPLPWGQWRWGPSAGASVGVQATQRDGGRHLEGLQATQTLSRDWAPGEQQVLSLSLSQSAGLLYESSLAETTRSLSHGLSLFWQAAGDGGRQRFVGLSASDARNWATDSGRFQLVNLQWTQREPFSRFLAASANLTLQATRNDSTQTDAFTGERRSLQGGWQRFYTAALSVEHQRAFGVPRLRWTLLAAANSQQLERRAFGDVEAPRERIAASAESRLDYTIGRLEARLAARVARIDDRTIAALKARVTRRF